MPAVKTRPDTPIPETMVETTDVQQMQRASPSLPRHKPDPLFPPSPYAAILPIQILSDSDDDTESSVPQSDEDEDEHTFSAYGNISRSQIIISPLCSPTSPTSPLQSRFPQPNLRLRVRRPPMPKRRIRYARVPDPLPLTGGLDPEDRWPGSPRPVAQNQSGYQHQPMLPPLSIAPPSAWTPKESVLVKNNGLGVEKPVNDPLPKLRTIPLSPPGLPSTQPVSRQHDTRKQKSGVPKQAQSPLAASPQKPKPGPWRTGCPSRPPIPKWDTNG